jgi:hypothetical protein
MRGVAFWSVKECESGAGEGRRGGESPGFREEIATNARDIVVRVGLFS